MGVAENKALIRRFYAEIDKGNLEAIDDQIAEGDRVVTRLTAYGRHIKDLPGIAARGQELTMMAVAIHRIADGKIVEHWAGKDELGFMQQLGVIHLPGHAPERETVPS